MPTLSEYFLEEARDLLNALEQAVTGRAHPDTAELHRAARGLRGTAQMAREDRVFRAAAAFENVTRAVAAGAIGWSQEMTGRALDTVSDLRAILDRAGDDEALDARATATASRWSAEAARDVHVRPGNDPAFHEFAAREAAGIAEVLDLSIRQLQADPMDREPLRGILRRQRALLGAARLEQIPVVAEVLRAIEDLTRVIAKLDVGVKQEWLDIFRVARDGLQATIAALVRGENPEPSNAVSRLRHMRTELLERYGEGEAVSVAHDTERLMQATPVYGDAAIHQASEDGPADGPVAAPRGSDASEPDGPELSAATIADDEPMLELTEVVDDGPLLELSDAVEDAAVLELSDAVEDDGVLELSEAIENDAVLELSDAVEEDAVLELSEAVEDEAVLELSEAVTDDVVLELSEFDSDHVTARDAGATTGPAPATTREAALRRALALREPITRVAAHDPQARRAVDELFDLIRTALE